ncbi:MAG: hypothetical protein U5L07_10770 [Desulfobacterales bacterium]|nr:hypothetical protein [Desulfobacterales bacterium]
MKKLVLVLAMLMVLPAAAFGIQYDLMNDGSMDEMTGQAGVSIMFDDIQLFLNIERIAWIDCDGFGTFEGFGTAEGPGGAVGLQNFQLDVLEINAITNSANPDGTSGTDNVNFGSLTTGDLELNWDYGQTSTLDTCAIDGSYSGNVATATLGLDNYTAPTNNMYSALTIDATSQLPVLSEQLQNNGNGGDAYMGGVLIGIPTMEVYIPSMNLTPAFYNLEGYNSNNLAAGEAVNDQDGNNDIIGLENGADFGTIEMTGITFTTLSGWIEIAPH